MTGGSADQRTAIRDIAVALGLSASTVSRALNGVYGVNEETRRLVRDKAEELGYIPHYGAKQLVGKSSQLVGVIMPEFEFEASSGFVFLLPAIQRELQRIGKDAIFFSVPFSRYPPKRLSYFIGSRGLDACVALPAFHGGHPLIEEALQLGIPCVNFEGVMGPRCSSVVADDYEGGYLAAKRLLEEGHRHIGHIGGPSGLRICAERYGGFRDALREHGIEHSEELLEGGDFSGTSGARAAAALFDRRPDMTALFCANDLMAAGAIQALSQMGIPVPDRVSVCGYDGDTYSAYTVPPLTTIRHSRDLYAEKAVVLLKELLAGRQGRTEKVPPTMLERQSIGRRPAD